MIRLRFATLGATLASACALAATPPSGAAPPSSTEADAPKAAAGTSFKIVTASERGTYIQIGRDLARFVAPGAGIDLQVLSSAGSAENVRRLRHEPGVKFALVQSDVYQAFIDESAGGQSEASELIRPLRVVMPLYNEEIYFVARADSPLEYVHEIRDATLNVGPLLSGTAMSSATLYRRMFGRGLPESRTRYLTNEDALVKLTGDKSVDVVIIVAGQPAKLFVDMTPEARQLIKLLKFDPDRPESKSALKTYFPATIRAASYPKLLADDVPGLAVKSFLVTYDYNLGSTVQPLRRFARSLCENFPTLQASGHPKWHEVSLQQPALGRGWTYYRPISQELQACLRNKPPSADTAGVATDGTRACSPERRALGLCR